MPVVLVLQEGNARTFVGFGDDSEWAFVQADAAQDFHDFFHIMAVVEGFNAPAKGFKTFDVNVDVVTERRRLTLAEAVDVHNRDEIAQLVIARERSGFPDRTFGNFAVTEENIGVVIQLILSCGERHTDADAKSLTERTRRHIGERKARRRMTFEVVAKLAEFQQFGNRDKAVFRPCSVKQRRSVAFRENEAVVVVVMRILRVILHVAEEECRDNIRRRAAGGGVAAAGRRGSFDGVDAQRVGDPF